MTNGKKDNDEILRRIEADNNLATYQGDDAVISGRDLMKNILAQKIPDFSIPSSGFPGLDALTKGFQGGELIVVSGPTKNGKSLYCQTLTDNFSMRGIPTLWFSYELRAKQFLNRFPKIPEFIYLPKKVSKKSLDWIEARILESILKFQTKVVFFDHLHFMVDMEKLRNPSLELGSLVRKLKTLACDYDILMFLICHITKIKAGDQPTEADLRDSSFIAQDADATLMIFRPPNKDFAVISVRNHRRTGVLAKGVRVKMVNGLLREISGEENEPV